MRYALIDEDGHLTLNTTSHYTKALDCVGPEGWNTIRLTATLAAFVNDCGLILTDRYRRNPIGGTLLIALGAQTIPYAGPIVITGWDPHATSRDDVEVIGLNGMQEFTISTLRRAIVDAQYPSGRDRLPAEQSAALDYLRQIITGSPVPPVTFGAVG